MTYLETADVYSYAEDETVEDPLLAQHLSFFGIDFSSLKKKMVLIGEVLDFLKSLIQCIVEDTLRINKANLVDIQICLQDAHKKIEFL